jgi:WD40 repeat protein
MMGRPAPAKTGRLRVLEPVWESSLDDHVQDLAWSRDGAFLAAAAVSGMMGALRAADGAPVFKTQAHRLGCASLSWRPGGTLLASGGQDGLVKPWDGTTGREILALENGASWVEKVCWNPDGTLLAFNAGKTAHLWHAMGGGREAFAALPSTIADLAWMPGTLDLAVAAYGGVFLFRAGKQDAVRTYPWKGSCLSVAWHPEGKYLEGRSPRRWRRGRRNIGFRTTPMKD